jgi:GNAT superfamily N-acetyltransferase
MLQIRAATIADAACILGFIRALAEYEREPQAVEVDEATLARQLDERPPPFECLIAELAGRPVAFALFFHTYSTWRGKRGIWLEDLFVLPEARRAGIGAALLARIAALALERNCARFEWSVLDWNTPAIDFYRSVGAQVLEPWRICRLTGEALVQLGDR